MSAADPLSVGEALLESLKQDQPEPRKRDQRPMPGVVWERIGSGPTWTRLPRLFTGITEAEEWIAKEGTPGKAYSATKGPVKALMRPISKVEEVDP